MIRRAARLILALGVVLAWVLSAGSAGADTGITTRVSLDSSGVQANGDSFSAAISADGRLVAFVSSASNLVAGDTDGTFDVFVQDGLTGITTRVSVDSSGAQANGGSELPAISADGRFVAFDSYASNLVAGDTNGTFDVFVHDRETGITTRVSVDSSGAQGNGDSFASSERAGEAISADGRFVAFDSFASNLVAGDTNASEDVFVHDRKTGTTTRVSVDSSGAQANGDSLAAAISADGQFVAFESVASNLVTGDTNGAIDVFDHDRKTGTTTRVSVDSSGAQANLDSRFPAISADGRVVAFDSIASKLVAGDTNGSFDVFVHDRLTGITTRVSVDSSGAQANFFSVLPAISADGRFVAFHSFASNLVAGDTNGTVDIFTNDWDTGITTRVSVDSSGAQGNGDSFAAAMSADGRFVAFVSFASNLVAGDTNGSFDVFMHDRRIHDLALLALHTHGPGVGNGGTKTHVVVVQNVGEFSPDGAVVSLSVTPVVPTCTAQVDNPATPPVETGSSLSKLILLAAGEKAHLSFLVTYSCPTADLNPLAPEFEVTADVEDVHGQDANPANDAPIMATQDVRP